MRRHTVWLAICIAVLALVPPAAAATHYTVRRGDTLTGIARRYDTSLGRLARMNHLPPYGILRIGTVLRVPGRVHTIAGTATTIAGITTGITAAGSTGS